MCARSKCTRAVQQKEFRHQKKQIVLSEMFVRRRCQPGELCVLMKYSQFQSLKANKNAHIG